MRSHNGEGFKGGSRNNRNWGGGGRAKIKGGGGLAVPPEFICVHLISLFDTIFTPVINFANYLKLY